MAKKQVAVVLAGSGVYDGAEIHEATFTLWAIQRLNAEYHIFAPDVLQHHVINHYTGQEMPESRNVLVESARIARGKIKPLSEFLAENFDAIMFPGGFGVAKNLSTLAFQGANCTVNSEVVHAVQSMSNAGKPIGALCIAPAVIAKVLEGATVTIGSDQGTIQTIAQMGASHQITTHGQVTIDPKYKLATTPCYMLDATISEIADGAYNVTQAVLEMA